MLSTNKAEFFAETWQQLAGGMSRVSKRLQRNSLDRSFKIVGQAPSHSAAFTVFRVRSFILPTETKTSIYTTVTVVILRFNTLSVDYILISDGISGSF